MNGLDAFLILFLGILALNGFRKGFLREAAEIAVTIAAIVLATNYWTFTSGITAFILPPDHPLHSIVSGAFIFFLVMGLGSFVAATLLKWVDSTLLTFPNKMAGLAFGAIKAAVILSLLLQVIRPFGFPDSKSIESSAVYPYVIPAAPFVYDTVMAVAPGAHTFADKMNDLLDRVKDYPADKSTR